MFRVFLGLLLCGGLAFSALADDSADHSHAATEASILTLEAATEKALAANPRLKSVASAIKIGEGEQVQAGLLPNPELGLDIEDFAGSGRYGGVDSAEITAGISQTVELGGKRARRQNAASHGLALNRYEAEAERLNLIRNVTQAYMEAVAAQEEVALLKDQNDVAGNLLKEVGRRVGAAREPLIQKSKAEITAATSAFALSRADRELTHAQHTLASLWGGHHETFTLDKEIFFAVVPPPEEATIEAALAENPDVKKWEAEKARSTALYALEQAQAMPDPRFSVGVRDYRDRGDQALIAGISIPIPVFNQNQGNIEKARHQISKTESDGEAARLTLRNEAYQAYEDMQNAYAQAENLKNTILPAAQKSFALAREGYGLGRFAYLEVLDSQRTLFDTRTQYIAAIRDYQKARAQVERFTAKHLTKETEQDAHAEK